MAIKQYSKTQNVRKRYALEDKLVINAIAKIVILNAVLVFPASKSRIKKNFHVRNN